MPGIDSNTKLMLHMDGADGSTTFTDSSASAHTVTANGNAQVDTAQSKFGGACGLFDGTDDFLSVPDHADWDFGTGDFTVDFWVRFSSVVDNRTLFALGQAGSTGGINISWYPSGTSVLQCEFSSSSFFTQNWTPTANTWYHIALVRTSGQVRLFVDGTKLGADFAEATNLSVTTGIKIGCNQSNVEDFAGWIDELRVSNAARWTADFTPPTEAYTTTSIKTWNGLTYSSVKTLNGLAVANVKNINGLA